MPSVPASKPRLILASASPARLGLLRAAGMDPVVMVSGVDEDALTADSPQELTQILATAKAEAVAAELESSGTADGALVIGCDSLLLFAGAVMGKPTSPEDAFARLCQMRGESGVLYTGHHLIDTGSGRSASGVVGTTVHFGQYSDDELRAYIATGEPLNVAGAFTLDGLSAPFIDGIEGDPSNVIGLSLPFLRKLLSQLGISITELWS